MNKFKFIVNTLNADDYDELVDEVIVTTSEGEITVLANHIPLITPTQNGRMIIIRNGNKEEYKISEGILKINKDEVRLMIETLEKSK